MSNLNEQDLYSPNQVRALFDEMYKRYGIVNLIASFGFTAIWRKVCVDKLKKQKVECVLDLMTGMGETLPDLERHFDQIGDIKGVDFSKQMCIRAREQGVRMKCTIEIIEADVFDLDLKDHSADVIISTFGLKTFSIQQQTQLARQIDRLLKPGGEFSLIEVSVPQNLILRFFYMLYITRIVPFIGQFCMGNPDNYRFLGVYTLNYGNSRHFNDELNKLGLKSNYFEHFFGCASGVYGSKP